MKQKITFFKVLLTLVLLCGVGNAWGIDFTVESAESVTKEGVTIAFAQGDGSNAPTWYSAGLRLYAKNTVTISSTVDITNITINWEKQGSKEFASATANCGTYNHPSAPGPATWTGNVKSITLTLGSSGQLQLNSLSVTVKSTTTIPCTVQFDGNGHGTPKSSSLTEVSAGSGITLPDCDPATGYVFKGWATTAGGTFANVGVAGETYYPSSNCTLYAVYNKLYTVTIETPENGTLVVKNGDTPVESGSSFEDGTTFTVEATPNEGYKFKNWQAVDNTTHTYTASNTGNYTLDGNDLTFKANFDKLSTFTIKYMINGVNTNAQENVYEGTALVFPKVGSISNKEFVGWSEAEISDPTDTKPTLVLTNGLAASENKTYYAVFANASEGELGNYNNVTALSVGKTYIFGAVKAAASATLAKNTEIGAVAFSNTYNDKSKNWGTAISITPNADGVILSTNTKVTDACIWVLESITNGNYKFRNGNNYIYLGNLIGSTSNGAQSGISNSDGNVYIENVNSTCANAFILHNNKTDGNVMLWNTSNGYRMYSPRTYSNTMTPYVRFYEFTPEIIYSAYCTSVVPKTQDVDITPVGYATAFIPFAATIEGATAYYVTVSGNQAQLNEIKGTIPANTGVVLKGDEGTVTFTESAVTPTTDVSENKMVGSLAGETFDKKGFVYYRLANNNGNVGFYKQNAEGWAECDAGKAVLEVPVTAAPSFFTFDDATAINAISNVKTISVRYNLNGQAVGEDYKGIVIVNGKKMFNK